MAKLDLRTVTAKLARKGITTAATELLPGGHIRLTVAQDGRTAPLVLPATSTAPRVPDNAVAWARASLRRAGEAGADLPTLSADPAPVPVLRDANTRKLHGRAEPRPRSRPPAWLAERRAAPPAALGASPAATAARPAPALRRPDPLSPAAFSAALCSLCVGPGRAGLVTRTRRSDPGRLYSASLSAMASAAETLVARAGERNASAWADRDQSRLRTIAGPGLSVVTGAWMPGEAEAHYLQICGLPAPVLALCGGMDALPPDTVLDPAGILIVGLVPNRTFALALTEQQKRGLFAQTVTAILHSVAPFYALRL